MLANIYFGLGMLHSNMGRVPRKEVKRKVLAGLAETSHTVSICDIDVKRKNLSIYEMKRDKIS
jgi:hypothetical protein